MLFRAWEPQGPGCNIRARLDQLRSGPGGLYSSRRWQARPEDGLVQISSVIARFMANNFGYGYGPLSALWLCGRPFWHAG